MEAYVKYNYFNKEQKKAFKNNASVVKSYHCFRHLGKEKIAMDFSIFAIAFNIGKLLTKQTKMDKNALKQQNQSENNTFYLLFLFFSSKKTKINKNIFSPSNTIKYAA